MLKTYYKIAAFLLNVIMLKLSNFLKKNIAQLASFFHLYFQQINAGNGISDVLDFKIFRVGKRPDPPTFYLY